MEKSAECRAGGECEAGWARQLILNAHQMARAGEPVDSDGSIVWVSCVNMSCAKSSERHHQKTPSEPSQCLQWAVESARLGPLRTDVVHPTVLDGSLSLFPHFVCSLSYTTLLKLIGVSQLPSSAQAAHSRRHHNSIH